MPGPSKYLCVTRSGAGLPSHPVGYEDETALMNGWKDWWSPDTCDVVEYFGLVDKPFRETNRWKLKGWLQARRSDRTFGSKIRSILDVEKTATSHEAALRLSQDGHRNYKGEHDGKKLKIRAEDEIEHGSHPGGRRQRRTTVWHAFIDGKEIGTANTRRDARALLEDALGIQREPEPDEMELDQQDSLEPSGGLDMVSEDEFEGLAQQVTAELRRAETRDLTASVTWHEHVAPRLGDLLHAEFEARVASLLHA